MGGNGVYRYGPSGFPNTSWNATSYWVDAAFERTRPPDTRAPKVSVGVPRRAAAGVALSSKVTVTFDEPLDPSTVNAGSITLKDDWGAAVVASVSYDDADPQGDPVAAVATGARQGVHAKVLSGTAGVTDLAGNRLAADKVWTFRTPAACPCTVFKATDAPAGLGRARPAGRGRDEVPLRRGRLHHRAAFLQAGEQHRHARGPPLVRDRRSCWLPRPSRTRRPPGWQTAELPNPVPVVKNTTYIASYHSSSGNYAFDPGYFTHGGGQRRR